ncbi:MULTISPECIES: hypothetical protein [unclassified Janthinobacterium]|uniref:hypothetical protein n=1 Tax=unclassified Janthinobacterium TaxID=2610881 RepID=UPI0012FA1CD7|nr:MULTISPECIES: hypothetical protein [unclassified Janthinobacterium]MEC5159355.1 hypothetical protein [Janthinobacterium sp. CG_S6]
MFCKLLKSVLFLTALSTNTAHAAATFQSGVIFDHSSVIGGMLIRFDPAITALPDNCGSATWMFIAESNKAMMAVTLLAIASGNRKIMVYTNGLSNSFCNVVQVDPDN